MRRGERGPVQSRQRRGAPRRAVLLGEGFTFVAAQRAGGRVVDFFDLVGVQLPELGGGLFDESPVGATPRQRDQTAARDTDRGADTEPDLDGARGQVGEQGGRGKCQGQQHQALC